MDVKEAIKQRRAYRSLVPVEIDRKLIEDLAGYAQLAPSCFNNQPWRFVFVYGEKLKDLHRALSGGNQWAERASMIIAVCSRKEDDCAMKDGREYYLFDTGMANAFLMLRATELGLVAHPIAGYDQQIVKEALNIPDGVTVITLVNVGKRAEELNPALSERQIKDEGERPARLGFEEFAFINSYRG